MRIVTGSVLAALALASAVPGAARARQKVPPEQVGAWAACAVEKNAGDVAWMYIVDSGQSGLKGPAFYGAGAYVVAFMTRDCVPEGTGFDGELIKALSEKAFALLGGDLSRPSQPRAIDPWADCLAREYFGKADAYLFARDISFANGPKLIVQGIDPVKAIADATPQCDSLKPAAGVDVENLDLYARLNYLVRVKLRLAPAASRPAAGEKH
jgi:hypothetical protein